jgi:hypothetical protein
MREIHGSNSDLTIEKAGQSKHLQGFRSNFYGIVNLRINQAVPEDVNKNWKM